MLLRNTKEKVIANFENAIVKYKNAIAEKTCKENYNV